MHLSLNHTDQHFPTHRKTSTEIFGKNCFFFSYFAGLVPHGWSEKELCVYWNEVHFNPSLLAFCVNDGDGDAFCLHIRSTKHFYSSHSTLVLQFSGLLKGYPLLCFVFLLPLQEFCNIFQCQFHAWKHITIHLCVTLNEKVRMLEDPANSYPRIVLHAYFEQLIHFLVQPHTRNACRPISYWWNNQCWSRFVREKTNPTG